MNVRGGLVRATALIVVGSLPLLGLSTIASASPKAAKGSATWCAAHPKKALCKVSPGAGSGTGGSSPLVTVEVDPNPLVETGQSAVNAVVQVETSPAYAGILVNIDSSQLTASCGQLLFDSVNEATNQFDPPELNNIQVALDDDGNATVGMKGTNCAPGTSVVSADLEAAPYLTALTTLVAQPPVVTPEGVAGYPQLAGAAGEVETGDTTDQSGNSDVYAVFYVETSPVYAEATVEIDSIQLESSCGEGWSWEPGNGGAPQFGAGFSLNGTSDSTILDDDGNAVFAFRGQSCAATTSEVIADVLAGTHPTYVTTWTTDPPAPTI